MTDNLNNTKAVGAELAQGFDDILSHSTRLRVAASSSEYDVLLQPAENTLNNAMTSISFIGQVKAGKTSLVNSLMGKPGFLPSDVNPWTAVVTRLFFGKPGGPFNGAQFSFFDDNEWDKFSNRGGRLGELAADIPGSENKLDEIRGEVERMRERAKKNLGEQFHTLLGRGHKFEKASSEVLSRYICAGDEPDGLVSKNIQGRFADITRDAAVYFEKEKFAVPTVLVDTPGLNDPLLIREEITLQSLEHSQIFVLVLSAHQAFSSADLYLLRILNALRLDRLVVFVNRVDELSSPETDIPEIRKHIANILARENPDADIPIIFGSASCASRALDPIEPFDPEEMAKSFAINEDNANLAIAKTQFVDEERATAWVASGVPELEQALSDMMLKGPGAAWMASARVELDNAAKVILRTTEKNLEETKTRRAHLTDGVEMVSSLNVEELDRDAINVEIEKQFNSLKHSLELVSNASWPKIRAGLHAVTEAFIKTQDVSFSTYIASSKAHSRRSPWSCDPTPLRSGINRQFRLDFLKTQAKMVDKLEQGVAEISTSLAGLGITGAQDMTVNSAEFIDQTPVTTALSKMVTFDMDPGWWKGWFAKFSKDGKAREQLAKMIRKQFFPIEDELMQGANENLVKSSTDALNAFRTTQKNLLAVLEKQIENSKSIETDIVDISDADQRISQLEDLIAACNDVRAQLQAHIET